MLVTVFDREGLDGREDLLTGAERRCLVNARFGARRRAEWIAGRVAARRALCRLLGDDAMSVSVVSASNGAPRAVGRPDLVLSLSHDGAWVAVATTRSPGRRARVAIDLCDARHHDRVRRLLRSPVDSRAAQLLFHPVPPGRRSNACSSCADWGSPLCSTPALGCRTSKPAPRGSPALAHPRPSPSPRRRVSRSPGRRRLELHRLRRRGTRCLRARRGRGRSRARFPAIQSAGQARPRCCPRRRMPRQRTRPRSRSCRSLPVVPAHRSYGGRPASSRERCMKPVERARCG